MNKKGDIFDGVMWANGVAETNPYSASLEEYPVDIQDFVKYFMEKWNLPKDFIPVFGGEKSRWIKDSRYMLGLSPKKYKRILDETFKTHAKLPFTILSIGSILSTYKQCYEQIEKDDAEKLRKFQEATKEKEVSPEDEAARKNAISELRKLLRKD